MSRLSKGLLILIAIIFSSFILAQQLLAQEVEVVRVGRDEVIDKDFYVKVGDVVEIAGVVNGDVVVAGGQVIVDGIVNGDLIAGGGMISVSGEVTQDARLFGGQITISGLIGRNLTAVGGNVDITSTAEVVGGVLGAGGNFNIAGPVGGEVMVGAGNLVIANEVGGDIEAGVGMLRLSEDASVGGDLTYYSDTEATISENAIVSGEIVMKETPESSFEFKDYEDYDFEGFGRGFKFGITVFKFLTALLFGVLLLKFYPNYTKRVAETVQKKFWKSLGVGFLALIITPLAILVLMVTIIGIPLGIMLGFTYMVGLYVAKIFIAYTIGLYVFRKSSKRIGRYWPMVVGLLIFYVVTFIPILGGLVAFGVAVTGFGAIVLEYRKTYEMASESKVY